MLSSISLSLQVLRGNIRETSATIGLHSNVEISIILDQGDELSRLGSKRRPAEADLFAKVLLNPARIKVSGQSKFMQKRI